MSFILKLDIYRPSSEPSKGLPFGVHSAGHYKMQGPVICDRRIIPFAQLFWCVAGSGTIEIEKKKRILKKHQIGFYFPGMYHNWYFERGYWEFYWLALDGPVVTTIISSFGLEAAIYDAGPPPVKLFADLNTHVPKPSRKNELDAAAVAFSILTRAAQVRAKPPDETIRWALDTLHLKWNSPEMSIKTLVASIGLRRASFGRRFHASVGMHPAKYLERLRIQNALPLLQYTSQSIKDVAQRCGFTDPNYFSRVIRRITGKTPLQLRSDKNNP